MIGTPTRPLALGVAVRYPLAKMTDLARTPFDLLSRLEGEPCTCTRRGAAA
jgi:hypothetical protein